jgi:hypothetical protein
VLEAFAGYGHLYRACYKGLQGCAIDSKEQRVELLAAERPDWITVQGDNAALLASGLMADQPFGLYDLDAYGTPLGCVEAVLRSGRVFAPTTWMVATDGITQKLRMGAGDVRVLRDVTERHGEDFVRRNYESVLVELVAGWAARVKLRASLERFYYCGAARQMCHWAVRLTKQ